MPGRPEEPPVSRSHPEHIFQGLAEDPLARAVAEQRAATVNVDGDLENCGRWPKRKKAAAQPPPNPFQELAEEFRRLAAEAEQGRNSAVDEADHALWFGEKRTWEKAAQKLEEGLNGQ